MRVALRFTLHPSRIKSFPPLACGVLAARLGLLRREAGGFFPGETDQELLSPCWPWESSSHQIFKGTLKVDEACPHPEPMRPMSGPPGCVRKAPSLGLVRLKTSGLIKEETGPRWDRITEQALLGRAWSWLLEKVLTDSWRPSGRPYRNSCSTQRGNRARELPGERGIADGTCVSRWCHSGVQWGVSGSENPEGQQQVWGFYCPGLCLIYWELMLSALLQSRQAQVAKYILLWAIFKAMGFVRICVKGWWAWSLLWRSKTHRGHL